MYSILLAKITYRCFASSPQKGHANLLRNRHNATKTNHSGLRKRRGPSRI